ncbi:amidase [Paraburkholderia sp.]|uniref:amidase n=1 Tax=Paraburkholderia sp. TaxID=1926495 RepID=UPI0039E49936
MMDWYRLTVREMGEHFRSGKLKPSQLLDHYLERIGRINPALNAFIFMDAEGARSAAAQSDARFAKGEPLGPLDGVPVAIKDNILVKGLPAVWGSRSYENNVSNHDELPVELLRNAGAVLIGKTNVPEFTLRGFTGNPVYGVTGNAWNPDLTPGGSSGGSVSAIAAGLVPLSLGTDGGGSIRRPAGYCGIVGLKPTLSRIPRAAGLPQVLYDAEVVGPLARTTDDVRLAMSVLATPDRRDSRSRNFAPISVEAKAPRALKICFVERFEDAPVDPEIATSCREAADILRNMGHTVEQRLLPFSIESINARWASLGNVGLSMLRRSVPDFDTLASPAFVDQAKLGDGISGAEFLDFIEMLFRFRSEVGQTFADYDIIMTPTAAANPWSKAEMFPPMIDGKPVGPRGHAVFTNWVNACAHPAISLPAKQTSAGMPIGFQLVGDFGADDLLLDIAGEYEKAFPWAQRWPEIAN